MARVGVTATDARADATAAPAVRAGFEHQRHDRDLVVGGGPSLPCTRCHVVRRGALVGRPDHASCFGACHGSPPVSHAAAPSDGDRREVCLICHAASALAGPPGRPVAVGFPPYDLAPDFALTMGHRSHAAIPCARCHPSTTAAIAAAPTRTRVGRAPPRPLHARCDGCHDGAPGHGPPMDGCPRCHRPSAGQPMPPSLSRAAMPTEFSHAHHATRGGRGAACATCHAALLTVDDVTLPRPGVAACGTSGCHDGGAAFATTVACTRCHATAPPQTFRVARPTARFVHADHAVALAALPCATCHPLDGRGEVEVAPHRACASCHAADFGAAAPRTCGACHTATEPWRHLAIDRRPAAETEFGASLDHARHLAPCAGCHTLASATRQRRPPRGHAACRGDGCHALTAGPAPDLGRCEACHQRGLVIARDRARRDAPWSTRARFDHAAHDGPAAGTCEGCHVGAATAAAIATMPAPPKIACAPCHDGRTSFKLTGTTCDRCHPAAP